MTNKPKKPHGAQNKPSGGTRPTPKPSVAERAAAQRREKFLTEFRHSGVVSRAAKVAGVSRERVYQWRDQHEDFAQAWDEAFQEAVDSLEAEAWRRGRDGVEKPVTFKGKITDHYTEYSDTLLMFCLRAHRSHFREKAQIELSGPGGGPLQTVTRIERVIVDPKNEPEAKA